MYLFVYNFQIKRPSAKLLEDFLIQNSNIAMILESSSFGGGPTLMNHLNPRIYIRMIVFSFT